MSKSEVVVIDARKVGDGGIGVYLDNLVTGFKQLRQSDRTDLSLSLLIPSARNLSGRCVDIIERWSADFDCIEESAAKYSASELFYLPIRHRSLLRAASVFHTPHITLPYGIPIPSIATIHDALLLTHARSSVRKLIARRLISSTLGRASAVITVSEQSKMYLDSVFANLGDTSKPRTQVVHNAVAAVYSSSSLTREPIQRQRILWIGNSKPHKGLSMFIAAMQQYASAWGPALPYQITVVCPQMSAKDAAALQVLGAQVYSQIDDTLLQKLYQDSAVLLLTSFEEGCGLPVLEAVSVGIPVVCTPLPSIREMCGATPYYSKDFSAAAIAHSLYQVLNEQHSDRAKRLADGRRRLAQFSPSNQSAKVLAIYNQVLLSAGAQLLSLRSEESVHQQFLQQTSGVS